MEMIKYEDGMLLLSQNYIFFIYSVVNFVSMISPTESTNILTA